MDKLVAYKIITGKILSLTGIHIGAGKETMEIGGTDNPIIRHPLTKLPYIPGSSLKGKMRCSLEKVFCKDCYYDSFNKQKEEYEKKFFLNEGKPCGCGSCDVCILF